MSLRNVAAGSNKESFVVRLIMLFFGGLMSAEDQDWAG
jgi:hypothetical protein